MNRIVPLSGVLAVGLLFASFAIAGEPPDIDAPVTEVVSFYKGHESDLMGSAFLGAYSALFLLFFAATLRSALRRAEAGSDAASALGFAGAIILSASIASGAALTLILGEEAETLAATSVQALHVVNSGSFFPFALGSAAFLIGSGIAVLKTGGAGRVPGWLGWPAIVFGILAFSPAWFVGIPGLGLWIITTSILLARSADRATRA